jgi:hypothetical protein
MFALSSKITFAKTVVADAPTRRAGERATHVVKVRANASMDKREISSARGRRRSTRVSTRRRWFGRVGARA